MVNVCHNLPVLLIDQWLVECGVPHQLPRAAIWIQLCTRVFVRFGEASAEIVSRVRVGLTGSRIAGALAQVPAELASIVQATIWKYGYEIGQDRMGLALWLIIVWLWEVGLRVLLRSRRRLRLAAASASMSRRRIRPERGEAQDAEKLCKDIAICTKAS